MVHRGVELKPVIDQLMEKGWGWEDICRVLKITNPTMRQFVRAYVLDRGRDDKE